MSQFVLGVENNTMEDLEILFILLRNCLHPNNRHPTEFNKDELQMMLRAVDHEIQIRRENEHVAPAPAEDEVEDDCDEAEVESDEAEVESDIDDEVDDDDEDEVEDDYMSTANRMRRAMEYPEDRCPVSYMKPEKKEDDDDGNPEADEAEEEAEPENRSLRVSRHPNSTRPSNTTFLFGPVRMGSKTLRSILIKLRLGFVCFPEIHEDLGDGVKVYKVSIGLKDQSVANLYNRHTTVQMPTGDNMSIAVKLL